MTPDLVSQLDGVGAFALNTIRALFIAEPQGYLALAAMAFLFIRGVRELRRAETYVQRHRQHLRLHGRAMDDFQGATSEADRAREELESGASIVRPFGVSVEPVTVSSEDVDRYAADDAKRLDAEPPMEQPSDPATPAPFQEDPLERLRRYVSRVQHDDHAGRILNLVYSHRRLANPDTSTVVAAIRGFEVPELERQRRTPNILMLVGLAGTVLGLASTVGRIDVGLLGPGATAGALGVFEGVLQQLPTAFVATIWGIVSALVFGAFVGRTESRTVAYVEDLERVATVEWVPVLWPSSMQVQYEDLRKATQKTSAMIASTSKLMKSITDKFSSTLSSTSASMGEHVASLAQVSGDTRQAFQTLSVEVTSSVQALDRGSQEMRGAIDRLHTFHGEMQGTYERLDAMFKASQQEARAHVEATLDTTRAQQERFNDVTDKTMLQLGEVSRSLATLAERLDTNLAGIESVRDTMLASVDAGFTRTSAAMDAGFTRTSEVVGGEFARATDAVAKSASELAEPVGSLQELIRRSLVGEAADSAVVRVSAAANTLSQAVERWEGVTVSTLGDGGVAVSLRELDATLRQLDATLKEIEVQSRLAPASNGEVQLAVSDVETPLEDVIERAHDAPPDGNDIDIAAEPEDSIDPVPRWRWSRRAE